MIASAIRFSRITFAMNFPEPSGSSPAEKPPANATICAFSISALKDARDSSRSFGVLFLKTRMCESAPARLNARAMSYSQFVPGNTGTITRGFALLSLGVTRLWRVRLLQVPLPLHSSIRYAHFRTASPPSASLTLGGPCREV